MNQQTNNSDLMVSGPALSTTSIDNMPDKHPKKKKNVFGMIILVIVCILLIILIAAGVLVYCALKDNMPVPAADQEPVELSEMVGEIAKEFLENKFITLDSTHIDFALSTVKDSVNSGDNPFVIRDLFSEISDNKLTIYGRVDAQVAGLTVTVPAQINIGIALVEDKIKLDIHSINCGIIKAPDSLVTYVLEAVSPNLPENLTVENGSLLYDVSTLDEMIDAEIDKMLTQADDVALTDILTDLAESDSEFKDALDNISPGLSDILTADDDSFLFNIFAGIDKYLNQSGDWLVDKVSSLVQDIIDVNITDVHIEDDKLIIDGSVLA